MLYTAHILIVASCFEMASNDFWLCLEEGLANYSPAYGVKLVSPSVRNVFHISRGLYKKENKKQTNKKNM